MTTTLIYEPIAYISDDYFRPPKADGSISSRDNTDDQGTIRTRRLALNVTDGNAIGWTAAFSEVKDKERNNACNVIGSPMKYPIETYRIPIGRGIHHD
jgi:hypothetical protein